MGILDIFQTRKPRPTQRIHVEGLGELVWSNDDDSWRGHAFDREFYVDLSFSLPESQPELITYAISVLSSNWLDKAVLAEKSQYASEHPEHAAELSSLGIESLHFYLRGETRHINCQLGYGSSDRFWSLDFKDDKCTGMGFDS